MDKIDAYIQAYPPPVQEKLTELRECIKNLVPDASEKISYAMPTFYLNGNLVHYAAFGRHIGFYPGAEGVAAFEKELKEYKHAKGSIQFPLQEELPYALIKRIVLFRAKQQREKKKK